MKSIEKIIENYVYCGILGKNVLKLKQKNAVLGATCASHLEKIYTVIKAATGRVLATAQVVYWEASLCPGWEVGAACLTLRDRSNKKLKDLRAKQRSAQDSTEHQPSFTHKEYFVQKPQYFKNRPLANKVSE